MKKIILNYRALIEREKLNNKIVYVAYAPTLGISDFGETVESAAANLRKAVQLYLDTLVELKKPVPQPDSEDFYVTTEKVELTLPKGFAFA